MPTTSTIQARSSGRHTAPTDYYTLCSGKLMPVVTSSQVPGIPLQELIRKTNEKLRGPWDINASGQIVAVSTFNELCSRQSPYLLTPTSP